MLDSDAVIEEFQSRLGFRSYFYFAPSIPQAKAARAQRLHELPASERIVVLYEDTLFGGTHDGMVATRARVCFKPFRQRPWQREWREIDPVQVRVVQGNAWIEEDLIPTTGWRLVDTERLVWAVRNLAMRARGELK